MSRETAGSEFSLDRLSRELKIDGWLRQSAFALLLLAIAVTAVVPTSSWRVGVLAFLLLAGWVVMALVNARVAHALHHLSEQVDSDPLAAEQAIGRQLRQRSLQSGLRLMLYHRLAAVRLRQRRYREAADICFGVLVHDGRGVREVRGQILLMMLEARLELGDLFGAFAALMELDQRSLTLQETLHRLRLQTRYELMAGHAAAAARRWREKAELAELLPADMSGQVHAMLARAVERAYPAQTRGRDWLQRRAELLASPDTLATLRARKLA